MATGTTHFFLSLTGLCLATGSALAQHPVKDHAERKLSDGQNSYSAEIRMGGEYDTNVSVDEVDVSSEQGDYSALLDGQLEFQRKFNSGMQFSMGYDFAQSLYRDFSDLDRQTHMFSGDIKNEFGDVDVGVSYHYVDSQLDGNDFLTLKRTSPYASTFLSKKLFARLAYVYSNKEVIERGDRDANTDAGELDLYYFVSGLRRYFNVGFRYKNEDANAARFDYKSNSFKLRYVQRFELLERLAKLELAWRFEDRDYSSPTPSIEEDRYDDRHRLEANLEIPVLDSASVVIYYKYSDYDSNLPRADYQQHITGTQFVYRW